VQTNPEIAVRGTSPLFEMSICLKKEKDRDVFCNLFSFFLRLGPVGPVHTPTPRPGGRGDRR
jgi:hypothetical protein